MDEVNQRSPSDRFHQHLFGAVKAFRFVFHRNYRSIIALHTCKVLNQSEGPCALENPMFLRSQELYSAFILFCCLSRVLSYVPMKAVRQFSKTYVLRSRVNFHSSSFLRAAKLLPGDTDGIRKAAIELRNGQLVAFPTETVYGLGAHAYNADAVQQIFVTKQRPNSDPLIVHVSNTDMLHELYDFHEAEKAASVCKLLTTAFWPGPLTIIFKAQPQVPSVITAGTGFVGVRCPKHPVALALIHEAGIPIAAPSAVCTN